MAEYIEREAVIAKLDELCRMWRYTALMPLFSYAINSLPYYVKGEFEATLDITDNWIEGCCEIICPKCNTHIKDEITNMCYDWKGIYPPHCPNCGKKLNTGE